MPLFRNHALIKPLGGATSQLLYRLMGWGLLNLSLDSYFFMDPDLVFGPGTWLFHLLALLALGLVVLGARPILLIALCALISVLGSTIFVETLRLETFRTLFMLAGPTDEEWVLYTVLSFGGLFLGLWARAEVDETESDDAATRTDWLHRRLFQVAVVTTVFFAGLHKLNSDFLDPAISCVNANQSLHTVWQVPSAAFGWVPPWLIVVLELLAPLLLIVRPRIGMLVTVLVLAPFGHIGATAFAGLMIYLCCSFLPEDPRPLFERFKRLRWYVLSAVVVVVTLSNVFYRGPRAWWPSALYQVGVTLVLFAAVLSLLEPRTKEPKPKPSRRQVAPIAVLAALLLLNGLGPYLGLKFRYSFAMYSNLRVDDLRWNSVIVPEALRFAGEDGLVTVERVRNFDLRSGAPVVVEAGSFVDEGLYSPSALRDRIRFSLANGVSPFFDVEYEGERIVVDRSEQALSMYEYLDTLPESVLFQAQLGAGPQHCVH